MIMDAFAVLKQDHSEVKKLFKKIDKSGDGATKAREKTFKELARELAVHASIEERIVYPRLKEIDALAETVNEGIEEHHVAEQLLEEIAQMPPEDEQWMAKVTVLQEMVEHHVEEEEKELFPQAAKEIDKDELDELGATIQEEKKDMMRGAHPASKEVFGRLGL
jgi:hemerythrin superfamily protein